MGTGARLALIAGGLTLLTAGVIMAARIRRDQVPGHAYAIPSANHRILIEVLNAKGQQGLARAVTRQLRQQGLDVIYFGSARAEDSTAILLRRGDPAAARTVAQALDLDAGRVRVATDTTLRVDVTVVLGKDFQLKGEMHP